MKQNEFTITELLIALVGIGIVVTVITFWGFIGYTVVHFVKKFW